MILYSPTLLGLLTLSSNTLLLHLYCSILLCRSHTFFLSPVNPLPFEDVLADSKELGPRPSA